MTENRTSLDEKQDKKGRAGQDKTGLDRTGQDVQDNTTGTSAQGAICGAHTW